MAKAMIHSPLTTTHHRSISYQSNSQDQSQELIAKTQQNCNIPMERSNCNKWTDCVIITLLLILSLLILPQRIVPYQQFIPFLNDNTSDEINYNFAYPNIDEKVPGLEFTIIIAMIWYGLFAFDAILLYFIDSKFVFNEWLTHFFLMIRMSHFCFAITFIGHDVIKLAVGAPRPYLLAIYDSANKQQLNNVRKSFISGHAAISMSMMSLLTMMFYESYKYMEKQHKYGIYVMYDAMTTSNPHSYYLCGLWHFLKDIPLLLMGILFVPMYFALYIGLTRVIDYKHFETDVVGGFVFGIGCALISYLIYWNEMYFAFNYKLKRKIKHCL
eukprot:508578_1